LCMQCQSYDCMIYLSAMDALACPTMKVAATCDEHCELQNSGNQLGTERTLHFRDMPGCPHSSEFISYMHVCTHTCVHHEPGVQCELV